MNVIAEICGMKIKIEQITNTAPGISLLIVGVLAASSQRLLKYFNGLETGLEVILAPITVSTFRKHRDCVSTFLGLYPLNHVLRLPGKLKGSQSQQQLNLNQF